MLDFENTKKLLDEAENKLFSNIDILINNAGIADTNNNTLIEKLNEEQLDKIMNINFKVTFFLSQATVKSMLQRQFWRVVNISSIAAFIWLAGHANYSSSKEALLGVTKTIAV